MRIALVSLLALAAASGVLAQSVDQTPPATPAAPPPSVTPPNPTPGPATAPTASPPSASAPTPPPPAAAPPAAGAPSPAPSAPAVAPPSTSTTPTPLPATMPAPATTPPSPSPPAPGAAPPAAGASSPAPGAPAAETPATPPPAPSPPPPPAPPTDPTAIALLDTLDHVCLSAANGGNMAQLAKAAGYRKSGDNFVYKRPGYQLTILSQGSNPTQCHVDVVHAVDPEAPAKPLVVALHDWANIVRGWELYRNDKNVSGSQEFTTRSWEHTENDIHQALVITTIRKADGSPSQRNADTSEMIYSIIHTPA